VCVITWETEIRVPELASWQQHGLVLPPRDAVEVREERVEKNSDNCSYWSIARMAQNL